MSVPREPDATVLISPDANDLRDALRNHGFQAISWPVAELKRLESTPALDEAVENLYGYDWLIFVNQHAANCFLQRLRTLGHDVSDLDSLRVCAIGDETVAALEETRVHVDVIVPQSPSQIVVDQLANYAGGPELLRRLNVLVPQAAIGRDYVKGELEEAGARVDVVAVYETVAAPDMRRLIAIQSMLQTGSMDAVVFSQPSDIEDFVRLFDTCDIGKLLKNSLVITSREAEAEAAQLIAGQRRLTISELSGTTLVAELARTLG